MFDGHHARVLEHDLDGVFLAGSGVFSGVALLHDRAGVLADELGQLSERVAVVGVGEHSLEVRVGVAEVFVHVPLDARTERTFCPLFVLQFGSLVQEFGAEPQTVEEGVSVAGQRVFA